MGERNKVVVSLKEIQRPEQLVRQQIRINGVRAEIRHSRHALKA